MEKDMELIKKQNKNQKILLIVLSVILVLSIGVSGYFIYDSMKADNSNNNSNNEIGNNNEENINIQLQDGDITNTDLAKRLHKTLITSDGSYGLYFSDKISITDTANEYFMNFNFRNYIKENNITGAEGGSWNSTTPHKFLKSDFNKYIQKKYNSSLSYNLPLNEILMLGGTKEIKSFENEYGVINVARSGMSSILKNKLIKAEQDSNFIHLYDNEVYCMDSPGYSACYLTIDALDCNATGESSGCAHIDEPMYECTFMEEVSCTNNGPSGLEEMSTYILNNMKDKLHTFKHTFKKGTDGNYYWVSSEIVNEY